jgi:hypothetical protein
VPERARSVGSRWRRAAAALGALAATAGVVGVAAWVGCSIYDPSLLLPAQQEGGPDVAVETGGNEAAPDAPDAPAPCPEVFPPPRPAADDPSNADNQTFIVALHTLDLGIRTDGGAAPLYGYDLDQVYTCCDGGLPSCKAPVAGNTHCDELGGRDNSGGQLIGDLGLLDPGQFNSDTISQQLQQGLYTILVQVQDYNGQPNDTQVVAALYASGGIEPAGDAAAVAKWDGTDVWAIDQSFVLGAPDASPILPNHYDAHAYVSGGVLVMQVAFPISLGSSATGITISLTGGVITGSVVPSGGTFKLANGQLAGRWNASGMLQAVQALTLGGAPVCPGTVYYVGVKSQICAAADIMTDLTQDNKGATCDALSVAFGFTADPAHIGDVLGTQPRTPSCSTDAAPDDCTKP